MEELGHGTWSQHPRALCPVSCVPGAGPVPLSPSVPFLLNPFQVLDLLMHLLASLSLCI